MLVSPDPPGCKIERRALEMVLESFVGLDVQQTNDEDFCRQVFRVLKMDASVTVDSGVFM